MLRRTLCWRNGVISIFKLHIYIFRRCLMFTTRMNWCYDSISFANTYIKNGSFIKVLIRIQKKMTPLWHSWYCLIYGLAQRCNLHEMSETGAKDVNTSTAVLYYSQNNSELTFPISGFQKCMKKWKLPAMFWLLTNDDEFWRKFHSKRVSKLK